MNHLRSNLADLLSGLRMNHRRPFRWGASQPAEGTLLRRFAFTALTVAVLMLITTVTGRAQEEPRSHIPVVGKIGGGTTHQAFSGKVQSVDLKKNLLKVGTVEGNATEFFPIKKTVPVSTASGDKIKVQDLAPGTTILVYYDQKEDRRTVSEILVLAPSTGEEKKKPPPPS